MTDDRYTPKMITDGKALLDQLLRSFAERGITGLRRAGDKGRGRGGRRRSTGCGNPLAP